MNSNLFKILIPVLLVALIGSGCNSTAGNPLSETAATTAPLQAPDDPSVMEEPAEATEESSPVPETSMTPEAVPETVGPAQSSPDSPPAALSPKPEPTKSTAPTPMPTTTEDVYRSEKAGDCSFGWQDTGGFAKTAYLFLSGQQYVGDERCDAANYHEYIQAGWGVFGGCPG